MNYHGMVYNCRNVPSALLFGLEESSIYMQFGEDKYAYDSVAVGYALRYIADKHGFKLNMTQLNKLLYIAYGVLLIIEKERLTKEHPAAWPYGPVFPRMTNKVDLNSKISSDEFDELPPLIQELLDVVAANYGSIPANRLSAWSHEEGSPWSITVSKSPDDKWNQKISDDDIYLYFRDFLGLNHEN